MTQFHLSHFHHIEKLPLLTPLAFWRHCMGPRRIMELLRLEKTAKIIQSDY